MREIIGRDNEMGVKFFAPFLLAMPEVLHALALVLDMESAAFVVEAGGRRKVATLKPAGLVEMMPPDTDTSWLSRVDWVDARDGAQKPLPLWLKDPRNKLWFEYLPDAKAVYVSWRSTRTRSSSASRRAER